MRFPMPEFVKSPYVESETDRATWTVRADAPEDVRRDLQKQIDEWNKQLEEAQRELGYPA